MRTFIRRTTIATLMLLSASSIAAAKDSLAVTVTTATGSPIIVHNGQASGTIQLFYTVNAQQFQNGLFATFNIDWTTVLSRVATNYGTGINFELTQDQQGGHVRFVTSPSNFLLTSAGQNGTSQVSVYIANDKDGNAPPSVDGTTLVGNLKLDAGSKVGSVTSVQVHIVLAHPTACLKVYNFVTDQDMLVGVLDTANVAVHTNGPKAGLVKGSQPGQFSDNVLVANGCATAESFDLRVTLDANFSTNPAGNPGNAVHAYKAAGEFDPTTFAALLTATSTAHQQNLCLQNMTVAPGASLLVTVHSEVKDGLAAASLPADREFHFWASLYDSINGGCMGEPKVAAAPNPASFTLPFTVNGN
jgi:hypothetical protein